jgi:hypothetical protein
MEEGSIGVIEVLTRNWLGRAEETHEEPQLGRTASMPSLEPTTF